MCHELGLSTSCPNGFSSGTEWTTTNGCSVFCEQEPGSGQCELGGSGFISSCYNVAPSGSGEDDDAPGPLNAGSVAGITLLVAMIIVLVVFCNWKFMNKQMQTAIIAFGAVCWACWSPAMQVFLLDFWEESQRYNVFVGLFCAFGLGDPPSGFKVRKVARIMQIVLTVLLSVGLGVTFQCGEMGASNSVGSRIGLFFVSLIFITIPLEIYKVLTFQLLVSGKKVKAVLNNPKSSVLKKTAIVSRRWSGLVLGMSVGLGLFAFGLMFFITALSTHQEYCNKRAVKAIVANILLVQMLVVDTFMALPYWRNQGWYLSLIGVAGPIVGLYKHYCEFGWNRRPDDEEDEDEVNVSSEAGKECDKDASDLVETGKLTGVKSPMNHEEL